MEALMGRELRIRNTKVLGMWYNALGFFAAPVFLYFMFDDVPLRAPYVLELAGLILAGILLLGIRELARALFWTVARVQVDFMGISLTGLSGQTRLDFMNLDGMDFLDKDGVLRLMGRNGETLDISTSLQHFKELLQLIVDKATTNQLISHMGDHYPCRQFNPMTAVIALGGGLVAAATGVLLMDSWFIATIVAIGLVFSVLFALLTGLRWVELDGHQLVVRFVWRKRTVDVADIQDVQMVVKDLDDKNKRKLVIQVSAPVVKDIEIPMRGKALLPLFVRLKQMV